MLLVLVSCHNEHVSCSSKLSIVLTLHVHAVVLVGYHSGDICSVHVRFHSCGYVGCYSGNVNENSKTGYCKMFLPLT
jgi:hypothetical protein